MRTSTTSSQKVIVTASLLALTILASFSSAGDEQQPNYGFFPSKQGQNHKKFIHNIFGFSIDVPSTWVFGVNGAPPTAVVILYPEGLDTSKFSKDYETIEIGQISFSDETLEKVQKTVMKGMSTKHPTLAMLQNPAKTTVNSMPAISWTFQWPSKTGYTVIEYITLVACSSGTRSLAVRTTRGDYASRLTFYDGILRTFEPFNPLH